MMKLVIDFETRSMCDLKACGAPRYAQDPTTEVLCLSYGYHDSDSVHTWFPGEPMPDTIRQQLEAGYLFVAHKASFEKWIWRKRMMADYGWPDIPDCQWEDTLATAAYKNLPQGLDEVTRILRLPYKKDMVGSKLTVGLSKLNKKGYLPEITPAILARVGFYCEDDVVAQRGLLNRIGSLPPAEYKVWLLDQTINQRGFAIDMDLVRSMQRIVDDATVPLAAEFKELTGDLRFTQVAKFVDWCRTNGFPIANMQAETVATALGASPDFDEDDLGDLPPLDIPDPVRRALEIRQLVGSAAVKKLHAAEACVMADGRVRDSLQYHGAGPGRWAGRLLQPHNFPRGTIDASVKNKVAALQTGNARYVDLVIGPPVETVVSSLRHIIVPGRDCALLAGDYSGIEARLVLSLAGQSDKTALMAAGADVYCDMATAIYKRPVVKAETERRQIGKNSVLGLGFGMGGPKFYLKYGKGQSLDFCKGVVKTYREEWAPKVPILWRALHNAAWRCVHGEGPQEAYGLQFKLDDGFMTMRLHSGRLLSYYDPQPIMERMPWSDPEDPDIRPGWSFLAKKMGHYVRVKGFGGLIAQNWTEGAARDLLVKAMFTLEDYGHPLILSVHDEAITEPLIRHSDPALVRQIMVDTPAWACEIGVPIGVDVWPEPKFRYGKY